MTSTGEALTSLARKHERTWFYFDPVMGGVRVPGSVVPYADGNGPIDADASPGRAWRVRRETIDLLTALSTTWHSAPPTDAAFNISEEALSALALDRANRLLASYLRYVFGREPKMLTVLFGSKLPR